jgi:hypothetical protein
MLSLKRLLILQLLYIRFVTSLEEIAFLDFYESRV